MDTLTRELLVETVHKYVLIRRAIESLRPARRQQVEELLVAALDPHTSDKHAREAEEVVTDFLFEGVGAC